MSVFDPTLPAPRHVAYALVPGDEEIAYVATDSEVLTRVIVWELVAKLRPDQLTAAQTNRIREALRAEDWQEAVLAWMDATGRRLNIFADEPIWAETDIDAERLRLELQVSPIFED